MYTNKLTLRFYTQLQKKKHQLLLGANLESRIKKQKYIYTMFLNNQYCINSLNIVTVLLKSVHAVNKCLDKGSIKNNTSSLENEYLVFISIRSLVLNSSNKEHDPLLQQ